MPAPTVPGAQHDAQFATIAPLPPTASRFERRPDGSPAGCMGSRNITFVTKYDLIAKLADRYPQLAATNAKVLVTAIIEAMTSSLVKGQRIEIRRFGLGAQQN